MCCAAHLLSNASPRRLQADERWRPGAQEAVATRGHGGIPAESSLIRSVKVGSQHAAERIAECVMVEAGPSVAVTCHVTTGSEQQKHLVSDNTWLLGLMNVLTTSWLIRVCLHVVFRCDVLDQHSFLFIMFH